MSVHFNPLVMQVQLGAVHVLVQVQDKNSRRAVGAGSPVIHLIDKPPSPSRSHPWSTGVGTSGQGCRLLLHIAAW